VSSVTRIGRCASSRPRRVRRRKGADHHHDHYDTHRCVSTVRVVVSQKGESVVGVGFRQPSETGTSFFSSTSRSRDRKWSRDRSSSPLAVSPAGRAGGGAGAEVGEPIRSGRWSIARRCNAGSHQKTRPTATRLRRHDTRRFSHRGRYHRIDPRSSRSCGLRRVAAN